MHTRTSRARTLRRCTRNGRPYHTYCTVIVKTVFLSTRISQLPIYVRGQYSPPSVPSWSRLHYSLAQTSNGGRPHSISPTLVPEPIHSLLRAAAPVTGAKKTSMHMLILALPLTPAIPLVHHFAAPVSGLITLCELLSNPPTMEYLSLMAAHSSFDMVYAASFRAII